MYIGVYRGHFRMDQYGQNLNRYYNNPDPVKQPSIYAAQQCLNYYASLNKLSLYLDLHAHSSKRGCFIYGNVMDSIEDQIQNQLFCKLIALNTPHFDYDGCLFSREHMVRVDPGEADSGLTAEGSGRVATYLQHHIIHSYTLECNYNTGKVGNEVPPTDGDPGGKYPVPACPQTSFPEKYTPSSYASVGQACMVALLDIRGHNPCSRILRSKSKTLERLRYSVLTEVKTRSEYKGQVPPSRRRVIAAATAAAGGRQSPGQSADDMLWKRVIGGADAVAGEGSCPTSFRNPVESLAAIKAQKNSARRRQSALAAPSSESNGDPTKQPTKGMSASNVMNALKNDRSIVGGGIGLRSRAQIRVMNSSGNENWVVDPEYNNGNYSSNMAPPQPQSVPVHLSLSGWKGGGRRLPTDSDDVGLDSAQLIVGAKAPVMQRQTPEHISPRSRSISQAASLVLGTTNSTIGLSQNIITEDMRKRDGKDARNKDREFDGINNNNINIGFIDGMSSTSSLVLKGDRKVLLTHSSNIPLEQNINLAYNLSGTRMSRDELHQTSDHITNGKSHQVLYDKTTSNHLSNINISDNDNDNISIGSLSVSQKISDSPKKGSGKSTSGPSTGVMNGIDKLSDESALLQHESKNGSRVTLVKSVIYNDIKKAKTLSNEIFEENFQSKDVSMVLQSIRNRRTGAGGGMGTTDLQEYCHRVRGNNNNAVLSEDASYEFGHHLNPMISESDARSDGGDSVTSVSKGIRRVSRLTIPKRVEGR